MKMDKTYFIKQSFIKAENHQEYYKTLSIEEQFEVFHYLMRVAYGFVGKPWTKGDKKYFSKRKLENLK